VPATDDASGFAAPVYVTTSVAVRGPVAVGANARLIMQLAPAFSVVLHELDDTTKSLGARPIVVVAMPMIAALELFVSVNADVGVVPPSGSAQKFVLPTKAGGGAMMGQATPIGGTGGGGGVSVTFATGWPSPLISTMRLRPCSAINKFPSASN
jgi:hypothetical protein